MKKSKEERQQYFFAVKQLVSREIKRKYARSYLGILWSVLNPLLNMAVMSLIFTTIFKRQIENFPIYFLTGNIIWNFFNTSTSTSMSAIVDNKGLLMKIKLPKETFILSRIGTSLVNLGYTFIPYVLMLVVFKVSPSIYMLLFFVDVFFLVLFSTGISFILATLYVFFADIKHLYSVFLTLWMYVSALFYPIDRLSGTMRNIVEMNPIYAYISFARECIMYGSCPDLSRWIQIIVWGIVMFGFGYLIYRKNENSIMQRV